MILLWRWPLPRTSKYMKDNLEMIKEEVGRHVRDFSAASVIKKFTMKYLKDSFIRTTGDSW